MMNDKELLELAAKAAGYSLHIWGAKGEENVVRVDEEAHYRWNPLTDDGDALRLAVKLAMWIYEYSTHVAVAATYNDTRYQMQESVNDDPYAATRRAIVRATAEIGRKME